MTTTNRSEFKEDWWRTWFNTIYMDVYAHRSDEEAQEEVQTTLSVLPLLKHHKIVDLCCGNGRHSRALYDVGYQKVTGIDYSYPLIKHAKGENSRIKFIRADMRMLPLRKSSQDGLLTYFTTIGYFQNNTENLQVLHEISSVLKPGGWFLIDYLNPHYVKANFEPETVKQHGEYQVIERRKFTEDQERIEKEIIIKNWGGTDRTFYESVRLYSYDDMIEMLSSTDLHVLGCLGSFDGRFYEKNSPRMILFGTRK